MSGLGADAAWLGPMPWLPVLAPAWPLTLLALLLLPPLRGAVVRLAPWAALPALLLAVAAPQSTLPLPGLMLGGSVQLDATGRWLLAAVALLWLAGGRLSQHWLDRPRRVAAWLMALAGALWLPVTGDLPTALAAGVLAAYPLYGLLGAGRGARVLLASVVIADLLILEALLLLAKGGAGLDFDTLRMALAGAKYRDVVLALLLIGFGTKAGLMGLHYWLAPALAAAPAHQLGPTVAFTLAAGLLPLLRLLPLGEVPPGEGPWPAAALLPWLALAGGLWALVAGLLQAGRRAVVAYALSALTGLWLGLLGIALGPSTVAGISAVLSPAMALAGLGVAALLLAAGLAPGLAVAQGRLAAWALALLAALLALLAALGAALPLAAGDDAALWPLMGLLACVGILLGAAASLPAEPAQPSVSAPALPAAAVLVAGGLGMAVLATLSSVQMPSAAGPWSADGVVPTLSALLGGFAVGLLGLRALAPVPRLPAGDLLVPLERAVAWLVAAWNRLGAIVGDWRDGLKATEDRLHRHLGQQRAADHAEGWLRRWSTVTLLLLAAGAAVALLVQPG
ncbi:hypothetical protein [uncultured Thiohalocapsa sp.]|uniref:hypothetical protein n=1 Tax=uncultured Thiohalocapsa sp. TaxID=768990 RepID=UPI0025D661A7|nr:hypothetical protein [uncultured Thiohalocapsa sp.]